MAEWHIEFTLSVCVCLCICISFIRLGIPEESCPTNNFVMHGGILKLFGLNGYQDKTICRV